MSTELDKLRAEVAGPDEYFQKAENQLRELYSLLAHDHASRITNAARLYFTNLLRQRNAAVDLCKGAEDVAQENAEEIGRLRSELEVGHKTFNESCAEVERLRSGIAKLKEQQTSSVNAFIEANKRLRNMIDRGIAVIGMLDNVAITTKDLVEDIGDGSDSVWGTLRSELLHWRTAARKEAEPGSATDQVRGSTAEEAAADTIVKDGRALKYHPDVYEAMTRLGVALGHSQIGVARALASGLATGLQEAVDNRTTDSLLVDLGAALRVAEGRVENQRFRNAGMGDHGYPTK